MGPRLRRHEYEHVLQFHELGRVRFLLRYLGEYLRWRWRRHGHDGAYRRISSEVRAEWRARREVGIGVGGPPAWADGSTEIGRGQLRTPVTNAHLVCRLLL